MHVALVQFPHINIYISLLLGIYMLLYKCYNIISQFSTHLLISIAVSCAVVVLLIRCLEVCVPTIAAYFSLLSSCIRYQYLVLLTIILFVTILYLNRFIIIIMLYLHDYSIILSRKKINTTHSVFLIFQFVDEKQKLIGRKNCHPEININFIFMMNDDEKKTYLQKS